MRALMIGVAAIALLSGVSVRSARQARSIEQLSASGGYTSFEASFRTYWMPRWLYNRTLYWVDQPTYIGFGGSIERVVDADLAPLRNLHRLERLSLIGTDVTDEGLRHLHHLSDLRWVDLSRTEVTDAGVAELQAYLPSCTIVRRPGSQLTD